jgi:hypothetical protein
MSLIPMLRMPLSSMSGGARGPGETNPGCEAAGCGEHPVSHGLGDVFQNLEGSSNNAVGLGVAGPLCLSRCIPGAKKVRHGLDDLGSDPLLLGQPSFLGYLQVLVGPPEVDQPLHHSRDRLLKNSVEAGAKQGIDTTLEIDELHQDIVDPLLHLRLAR